MTGTPWTRGSFIEDIDEEMLTFESFGETFGKYHSIFGENISQSMGKWHRYEGLKSTANQLYIQFCLVPS